jgi:hypothetical protein
MAPGIETTGPVDPLAAAPEIKEGVDEAFLAGLQPQLDALNADPKAFTKWEMNNSWGRLEAAQDFIKAAELQNLTFPADLDPRAKKELQVQAIIDALTAVGTLGKGQKPDKKASRYLYLRQAKLDGKAMPDTSLIGVNVEEVDKDIQSLRATKEIYTTSKMQIDALICLLEKLKAVDPARLASFEYGKMRANSQVNRTFGYAGRLAGTVAFGGFAVITGIMTLVGKTKPTAAIAYAAAAYACANPDAFSSRDSKLLKEAGGILRNNTFTYGLYKKYQMSGPQWADAFDGLMTMDDKSNSALQKYQKGEIKAKELALALVPDENTAAHGSLLALIENKGDFDALLKMIKGVKSKESKELVLSYIRAGAGDFATPLRHPKGTPVRGSPQFKLNGTTGAPGPAADGPIF